MHVKWECNAIEATYIDRINGVNNNRNEVENDHMDTIICSQIRYEQATEAN